MMKFREFFEATQYGDFRYLHSCPSSTYEDITDMTDKATDITRRTFMKYVNREDREMVERDLGYDRDFPITRDWHVSYSKSVYRGQPCVYLTHSAIEYIFTPNGQCGPSLAPERQYTDLRARSMQQWQPDDE